MRGQRHIQPQRLSINLRQIDIYQKPEAALIVRMILPAVYFAGRWNLGVLSLKEHFHGLLSHAWQIGQFVGRSEAARKIGERAAVGASLILMYIQGVVV